jgi:hypothetical protein
MSDSENVARYKNRVMDELKLHLTEGHKKELLRLFFGCFTQKSSGDFINGYAPGWAGDQSVPVQDRSFLSFAGYQQLGVNLGSKYRGQTLLEHPGRQSAHETTLILLKSLVLQKAHPHFDRYTNPLLLSRVIASSLVFMDDEMRVYYADVQLGRMSNRDAFIHWMITKECRGDVSCLEAYPLFELPKEWSLLASSLTHHYGNGSVVLAFRETRVCEEESEKANIDAVMGCAAGVIMHTVGKSANHGLTRQHLRQTYVALLSKHPFLLRALRDHLFLRDTPCLLLNLLRTPDKSFELTDTKEFLEVIKAVKAGPVSAKAMLELSNRMQQCDANGQRSPRDAVLYLALNQQLSDEEFDRIAKHHLYHDFPLGDKNHEAVKSALRFLNQEAIDSLKTRLALLAVDRDPTGIGFKVKHGIENSERELQNNLLMHVIMAGKHSLDPKLTKGEYKKMKTCIKKNYPRAGIYTLFKQPLPPGEAALGSELQKGDSLLAPLLDQRTVHEAQRRHSVTLNGGL